MRISGRGRRAVVCRSGDPFGPVLAPADGGPLGLLLGLLDEGEELHAGVVKPLVHEDPIKEVSVLQLHQPGRLLQLQEVVLLQEEMVTQRRRALQVEAVPQQPLKQSRSLAGMKTVP